MSERRPPGSRPGLTADSPLMGGSASTAVEAEAAPAPDRSYPTREDELGLPRPSPEEVAANHPDLSQLRQLIGVREQGRALDDWGRSERVFDLMQPLLDFYYRYWFRVETKGVENVPSEGGALLTSNHSGALPPDAPMIMQAVRHEHPDPRPLYMLAEHWFKGYPGVGLLTNKMGIVPAHPANASRLLRDERKLALVFPEGMKATRKLYWQRYKLRRFGRGGAEVGEGVVHREVDEPGETLHEWQVGEDRHRVLGTHHGDRHDRRPGTHRGSHEAAPPEAP